jgi:hypothetical protein
MGVIVDDQPIQRHDRSAEDNREVTPTIEALLREELRNYATELRKLAYSLPNGVGERALLRLSAHMTTTADQFP